MDHPFRPGDLVILVYPNYDEESGERTKGAHPAVKRAILRGTPLRVRSVNFGNVEVEVPDSCSWNVYPDIVHYATEEARAEVARKAAEEERKIKELMAKPIKPLLDKAKKALRESEYAKGNSNGVAVHVKRGSPLKVMTGPCHGFIRNQGGPKSAAIVTLLVRQGEGYGRRQCKEEVLVAYYDWLLSRSPYSSCFYGKSGKVAVKGKVTALRTNVPANMLQGALICTRNTWEFPEAIHLWYALVKHGVNENAAFVACHFASRSGDQVRITPVQRDHIAIATSIMTAEGLKAFIEGKPLYTQKNYNEGGNFQGVQRAFIGEGEILHPSLVREFEKYGEVSSVIRNPFVKAKPRTSETREMGTAKYASFVKDIFPKLIN